MEKAKIARETIGVLGLDRLKIEFTAARKLKNRGILYKLNSSDAIN